jgi:hypothetical protein
MVWSTDGRIVHRSTSTTVATTPPTSQWPTWRAVDCSAAAPDWLLGAYGHTLGSLDAAIAVIGPGSGISTTLGLTDARGPAWRRR